MKAWLKGLWGKEVFRCFLIFVTIIGNMVGTFWFLYHRLRTKTSVWATDREAAFDGDITDVCLTAHPGQDILCGRLAEQHDMAIIRAKFHADLFSHYISEHFAAISVTFACGILTAATVTYIVRHGWENSHNYVNTAFIAFSICVAFFGGYPQLAQHSENVKDNEFLFLAHGNLVGEIRTYCATGTAHPTDEEQPTVDSLAAFVVHVDAKLFKMNRIPLEFDAGAVDLGTTKFMELQPE